MNKCIYLNSNNKDLEYNSGEHIIPAGLGGISKLPKGYVSDKANNLFSKYELKALRHSMLTRNRLLYGPGKRGNQSVIREKKSKIMILKDESTRYNHWLLGYVFSGKSYLLPQLYYHFNLKTGKLESLVIGGTNELEDKKFILTFKKELNIFLSNENRKFNYVDSEFDDYSNLINIGFYRNKWYISTNSCLIDVKKFLRKIYIEIQNNKITQNQTTKQTFPEMHNDVKFRFTEKIDFLNNSFFFVFLKTAFNSLAYLLGHEFILLDIFNNLREDIYYCRDVSEYLISNNIHKEVFGDYIKDIPKKSHYVFIVSKNNKIYAYVSFYDAWYAHLILTNNFFGEDFAVSFICDWKNKKEYSNNYLKN